jgi:hypothetical protein
MVQYWNVLSGTGSMTVFVIGLSLGKELLGYACIGMDWTLLWIFFLFMLILPKELFIGPPWLKGETMDS